MKVVNFFTVMNHSLDPILDKVLLECVHSGIKKVNFISEYRLSIIFNNGITYSFWNANKYYAWMRDGTFTLNEVIVYSYNDARPLKETMNEFATLLAEAVQKAVQINQDI